MTYARQRPTYIIDGTPTPNTSYEKRTRDNNTTKKFLTNSDKSIFNLKWQVGGVVQENYQRNRRHSQHDKNRDNTNPRNHSPTYHHHHQEQSKFNDKSMFVSNSTSKPITYYYPYAYPPMPVSEQIPKSPITNRTITRSGIKQTEKSVNLLHSKNTLKIEHHYVDSPDQAQKLIDDLRRKGFVETGIEIPAVYPNNKRKQRYH